MRKTVLSASLGLVVSLFVASTAFAAANPQGTGQPSQECGSQTASVEPNGFSTDGFAHAETVYAGSDSTPSQQNAQSSHAVAQYDVACFQQTANH